VGIWADFIKDLQKMSLENIQLLFPAYDIDRWFPEPDKILEELGQDYEIVDTTLRLDIPIYRYAQGLDVISFEYEQAWKRHPLGGLDGNRRLGFAVFDTAGEIE
jgi:hypothetical protein